MTTEIRPNAGPGSYEIVPGQESKAGLFCVQAGDRVTFTGWKFKNYLDEVSNISPDSLGYLPHFSIRPRYVRDAGIGSGAIAEMRRSFGVPLSGNIEVFPFIRVDLGSVWFPFAAEVKIDGGNGPGPEYGTLLLTLEWERQRWHINSSTSLFELATMVMLKSPAEAIFQLWQSLFSDSATPVVEKRDEKNHFTIYNAVGGTPIPRPTNAIGVYAPNNVNLRLDNGTNTYSTTIGSELGFSAGIYVPLGPFSVITPSQNCASLTFAVQL